MVKSGYLLKRGALTIALAAAFPFVWWIGFFIWLRIAPNVASPASTMTSISFVLAIALAFFFISGKEIRKQPVGMKVICFAASAIVSFLCTFVFFAFWTFFFVYMGWLSF